MSLLDTGDLEPAGQLAALAHPADLRVDVLKVAHHGSARQSPSFLQATGAVIALISVGADNPYGHPADRTVQQLLNDGMEVVRTDQHGSITVSRDPAWTITTQR
jgi:competence protein ComEC